MPKEYRTIQEVAGPLMLIKGVEGVTYNDLGEIESLASSLLSKTTDIVIVTGVKSENDIYNIR